MFERYTEKARRVIFFARYEASLDGSPYIEPQHLLIAILREDKPLFQRMGLDEAAVAEIQAKIEKTRPKDAAKIPTSVDLPLSNASKMVLAYAAEEAQRLGSDLITPAILLLGLLRELPSPLDKVLRPFELRADIIRDAIAERAIHAAPAIEESLRHLDRLVREGKAALYLLPASMANAVPQQGNWSRKQILGHLIDSASNNHQRFVRAQLQESLEFPGYTQDAWVACQHYKDVPWEDLVALWSAYNRLLIHVACCIPEALLQRAVKIGNGEPVTLQFLVIDYVRHLEHHLGQLLKSPLS